MKINKEYLGKLIELLRNNKYLNNEEAVLASNLIHDDFSFANQLSMADSLHYHIHVPDIEKLPHELFMSMNATVENKRDGYIKYGFPEGVKLIFSHIPVAQKEQSAKCSEQAFLDHIGIDIRSDNKEAYIIFQQIPLIAAQNDYYFKRQGDGVEAVKCCHMQVKEKYWVYAAKHVNYEFTFGPLVIHESGFGIDLRPANPFNKQVVDESQACCGEQPKEQVKAKIFLN